MTASEPAATQNARRASLAAILARTGATAELFRLRSLHQNDSEGRAAERKRRALLTGVAAGAARAVTVTTSLITVPITLSYLGAERFGVWMAISGFLTMMGFADFGIGNGVMNAVADAHGRDDQLGVRRAISSGLAVLSGIAVLLFLVFASVYPFVTWPRLFNVHSRVAAAECGPALAVFVGCFLLNIPAGIIQRVQLGLQQGFRSYIWQLAGGIPALSGVFLAIHLRVGLPWLLAVVSGVPLLMTLLNGALFFGFSHRRLRPSPRMICRDALRNIARLGGLFFVLQLVVNVAFYSDGFFIARILNPEAVTQYVVPQRMFFMVTLLLSLFTAPLWPAYAEAIARGDTEWVRSTLLKSLKTVVAVALAAVFVLLIFGRVILHMWVGPSIHPSWVLLCGLAVWTLFDVGQNAVAMFLNGASVVRFQVTVAGIFGLVCVPIKIIATMRYGADALPWATSATYLLLYVLPSAIVVPRIVASLKPRGQSVVASDGGA